jgi:nucleotide-binding universal stress UspA family protein
VILVPLGGDDHDRTALGAAFAVAQLFRSHIEGLFVRPDLIDAIADLEGGSPEVIGSVRRATATAWNDRAERAKEAFESARVAADAARAEHPTGTDTVTARWREVTGRADEVIASNGRLSDLIVLAGLRSPGDRDRGSMFAQALVAATRPILLVPDSWPEVFGKTVAVFWNGSAESARALSGAMPMLLNAEEVHVLTAASAHTEVERGQALVDYLGWHGVMSEAHALYPESAVAEALLAKAAALGADLLVMGGYGRSRFSELIFGGVTRHVLRHHQMPVLIAH